MRSNPAERFHGRPCGHCGAGERYVSSGSCVACTNARATCRAKADPARHKALGAAWNAAHPDRRRAIGARSRAAHPEYQRQWAKANPEKVRAKSRAWRARNPAKVRDAHMRWSAANPGRASALTRAWQKAHPARAEAIRAARRARKLNAEVGDRSAYAAFVKWARTEPVIPCQYCKRNTPPNKRHVDHYIPLSRGGADDVVNLRVACARCNHRKHALSPSEFMERVAQPVPK